MESREDKKITIAVDGHSSCGKSTLARELACVLGYIYLDSGAMYRAVTLFALRNHLAGNGQLNKQELVKRLDEISIDFRFNALTGQNDTYLNGENVEEEIRQITVSEHVSPVATIAEVRYALVKLQQEMGKNKGIVMDGRDIGTVVFPEAELKIFMTARPEVRARRRYDELRAKGQEVSFGEILENVETRDRIDSGREISPLKQAADALVLDNSDLTRNEQLAWTLDRVNEIIEK
ncbi:MAG: (d)CMP kinase [Prolixibacteraceae bacterium]